MGRVHHELILVTTTAKCIDKYIQVKAAQFENASNAVKMDVRLEDVVQRMFQRCYKEGAYQQVMFATGTQNDIVTHMKQAIGIAIESFRLDIVEECIKKGNPDVLLAYILGTVMTQIQHLEFRNQVCDFHSP